MMVVAAASPHRSRQPRAATNHPILLRAPRGMWRGPCTRRSQGPQRSAGRDAQGGADAEAGVEQGVVSCHRATGPAQCQACGAGPEPCWPTRVVLCARAVPPRRAGRDAPATRGRAGLPRSAGQRGRREGTLSARLGFVCAVGAALHPWARALVRALVAASGTGRHAASTARRSAPALHHQSHLAASLAQAKRHAAIGIPPRSACSHAILQRRSSSSSVAGVAGAGEVMAGCAGRQGGHHRCGRGGRVGSVQPPQAAAGQRRQRSTHH